MTREAEDVYARCGNVYRDAAGSLGSVRNQERIVPVRDFRKLFYGKQCTRDVGGVGRHNGAGVLSHAGRSIGRVQLAPGEQRAIGKVYTLPFQEAQGPHHRIMLDGGRDNMVARLEQAEEDAVERLRRVLREDDRERVRGADKLCHKLPRLKDYAGRLDGKPVAERPGLPPTASLNRAIASITAGGLGHEVAALSK